MLNYPNKKYISFSIIVVLLLWIIFTELIFPGNLILPSLSLIIISFNDLFKDYNFLFHLVSTISVIYGTIILSFLVVKIKFSYINFEAEPVKYLTPFANLFLIIPDILIGLLLIFWMEDKYLSKLIYVFFVNALIVYQTLLKYDKNDISGRIIAAKSAGISDQIINRKIVWKFIEPEIVNNFIDKHSYLWSAVIAFEFIQNYSGTGFVVRNALRFKDLSIILTIIIISVFVIFLGRYLLQLIRKKYFNWC